ncbi:MAG: hypothetical protein ACRCVG_08095 [Methanobacteriaceae archaeon]
MGILTEGDINSGAYAILTASTLSMLITIYESKKDSIEQMKKTEEDIIIQTTYMPMRNALIDLNTCITKKAKNNYNIGDAWTFTKIFESLLDEKFYKQLPEEIRKNVITNIVNINEKYKIEYVGYIHKNSVWAASFSRDYNDMETIKNGLKERVGIEDVDNNWGYGVFYFISPEGSKEFDLNVTKDSSNYDIISQLLRNAVTEKDFDKLPKIQKQIVVYNFKNDQKVKEEIFNPVLEIINDFLESISIEKIRDLILEDVKKLNQD